MHGIGWSDPDCGMLAAPGSGQPYSTLTVRVSSGHWLWIWRSTSQGGQSALQNRTAKCSAASWTISTRRKLQVVPSVPTASAARPDHPGRAAGSPRHRLQRTQIEGMQPPAPALAHTIRGGPGRCAPLPGRPCRRSDVLQECECRRGSDTHARLYPRTTAGRDGRPHRPGPGVRPHRRARRGARRGYRAMNERQALKVMIQP